MLAQNIDTIAVCELYRGGGGGVALQCFHFVCFVIPFFALFLCFFYLIFFLYIS